MAYLGREAAKAPIVTADIPDDSITSAKIVDATVAAGDLAANSVDSSELVDGSVDLSHMSVNSVDSDQYVDASIDSAHVGNDQIDSQHYAAGSIDLEHMSSESVDEDNLHVSNSPTDGYVLTARSSAAGDMTWEAAASGSVAGSNFFQSGSSGGSWTTLDAGVIYPFDTVVGTPAWYNTSTKMFTAPADGTYIFGVTIYTGSATTSDVNHGFSIFVNGAGQTFNYHSDIHHWYVDGLTNSDINDADRIFTFSQVIPLDEDDTVGVYGRRTKNDIYTGGGAWWGCRLS